MPAAIPAKRVHDSIDDAHMSFNANHATVACSFSVADTAFGIAFNPHGDPSAVGIRGTAARSMLHAPC